MASTLKLRASDGQVHEVDAELMSRCSATFRTMLEYSSTQDDDTVIPLQSISSPVLTKVIQWMLYHQDDPESRECICTWDADFLKVDLDTLYFLILAADYLEIQGLSALLCRRVANMIQGKTTEEMQEYFGIVPQEPEDTPTVVPTSQTDVKLDQAELSVELVNPTQNHSTTG